MVPYFLRVQAAGRSLIIRGSFSADELKTLSTDLDPRGLFLLIMVNDEEEIGRLKPALGDPG